VLIRKKNNLVFKDEYGVVNYSEWVKELERFWNAVLIKRFEAASISFYNFEESAAKQEIFQKITDLVVENQSKEKNDCSKDEVPTNPYEYEGYCRRHLEMSGWKAQQTPGSGDQGADVVAEKNNKRLVVQCKLWNQPVSNKAVQEIVSAKAFYSANVAAVVSNKSFTKSAKSLAAVNGVLLLHHKDIELLDSHIKDIETRGQLSSIPQTGALRPETPELLNNHSEPNPVTGEGITYCFHCQQRIAFPMEMAGKTAICPTCNKETQLADDRVSVKKQFPISYLGVEVEEIVINDISNIIQSEISQFAYSGSEKIPAMKHLRQMVDDNKWLDGAVMSLADAKWAVENFTRFIEFVRQHNRFPRPGYGSSLTNEFGVLK
jgi:restriction system protein